MTGAHIPALCEIERLCFSEPWTEIGFNAELHNKAARFFTAVCGSQPVGYIGMHSVAGEGYIANIAVHPDMRRRGIGAQLLAHILGVADAERLDFVTLEVRVSNADAIALYERFGFTPAGLRKNYYRKPPEDGLIMTKTKGK